MLKSKEINKFPMNANKKLTMPLALFMVIIVILSLLPIDALETKIKHKFNTLVLIKLNIENSFKVPIDISFIQNILHFPFYALLAFLWMGFLIREDRANEGSALHLRNYILFIVISRVLQLFLAERTASFMDLLLNLSGSLSGIGGYWLINKNYR